MACFVNDCSNLCHINLNFISSVWNTNIRSNQDIANTSLLLFSFVRPYSSQQTTRHNSFGLFLNWNAIAISASSTNCTILFNLFNILQFHFDFYNVCLNGIITYIYIYIYTILCSTIFQNLSTTKAEGKNQSL